MRQVEVPAYSIRIYLAGDLQQAKQVCRDYCYSVGLYVTISPTLYIYTGGEEEGFVVGLENYPRFPSTPEEIWRKAEELGELLREGLFQHSYLLTDGVKTLWVTKRDQ